jgi:hypothetical protein
MRTLREAGLHVAAVVALVVVVAALGGVVWFLVVALGPKDIDPDNVHVRIDTEFIPQARMTAQFPGRWVFERDPGSVLVFSRVQSHFVTDQVAGDVGGQTDYLPWFLERVWLNVPASAAPGLAIEVDTVHQIGHVGYDAGEYFAQVLTKPCDVVGKVVLLGIGPKWVVLHADLDIQPTDYPGWKVTGPMVVPVTNTGINATAYNPDGDAPSPMPPANPNAPPPPESPMRDRLVGGWYGQAIRPAPEIAPDATVVTHEIYLQFDKDGRCVMATVAEAGGAATANP